MVVSDAHQHKAPFVMRNSLATIIAKLKNLNYKLTMKKIIILAVATTINLANVFGQCTSLFSFAAYFETVTFLNQSSVPNAHYFWNFGDGTSSNFQNPIHKFPETGNYLVTLFAKDTISNCSSYYEYWVNLTKYSTDSCQTSITDSIFFYNTDYYLKIIDNSVNCNGYSCNYDAGPAHDLLPNNWIGLGGGWRHARFVSRVQYFTPDSIYGNIVHREAYKTSPFLYTSSKNYGDCSANFEFNVVSQDTAGQMILFKAMNSSAASYLWEIIGFGSPIYSTNDTISKYYPYNPNNDFWLVGLKTIGSSGCMDTLYQAIIVRDIAQTIVSIDDTPNRVDYNLYPNPFIDQTVLDFSSVKEEVVFTLLNSNGQLVMTINNVSNGQVIIEREDLPSGFYYFIVRTDDKIIVAGKLLAK